jgi:hypothetical protein
VQCKFRLATLEDAENIGDRMDPADRQEVWESHQLTGARAAKIAWITSEHPVAMEIDGTPEAMFGVCPTSAVLNAGSPWYLGTEKSREHKQFIAKNSRKWVRKVAHGYDYLENYVSDSHKLSVRWLKFCGFTIEKPEPRGPMGALFRKFWWRRPNVL